LEEQKVDTKRELVKLTVPALQIIAAEEKVVLPETSRIKKADYIAAIILSRYPAPTESSAIIDKPDDDDEVLEDNADDGGRQVDEDSQGNTAENTTNKIVNTQQQVVAANNEDEVWAKKVLNAYTNTKLIAIMAKANIVISKPGRKVKADYVNAIYFARHLKLLSHKIFFDFQAC
jgi:hypothetical protein